MTTNSYLTSFKTFTKNTNHNSLLKAGQNSLSQVPPYPLKSINQHEPNPKKRRRDRTAKGTRVQLAGKAVRVQPTASFTRTIPFPHSPQTVFQHQKRRLKANIGNLVNKLMVHGIAN